MIGDILTDAAAARMVRSIRLDRCRNDQGPDMGLPLGAPHGIAEGPLGDVRIAPRKGFVVRVRGEDGSLVEIATTKHSRLAQRILAKATREIAARRDRKVEQALRSPHLRNKLSAEVPS